MLGDVDPSSATAACVGSSLQEVGAGAFFAGFKLRQMKGLFKGFLSFFKAFLRDSYPFSKLS